MILTTGRELYFQPHIFTNLFERWFWETLNHLAMLVTMELVNIFAFGKLTCQCIQDLVIRSVTFVFVRHTLHTHKSDIKCAKRSGEGPNPQQQVTGYAFKMHVNTRWKES